LSTRLVSLRRSLAVETRLRDSAAKLVRLSAPGSPNDSPASPLTASRPRVTRQQAEAQLALAQKKLDAVEQGVSQAAAREAELQTKLLAHTAGVLSAALRNRDAAAAAASSAANLDQAAPGSVRSSAAHLYASHGRSIDGHDAERSSRLEQDLAEQKAKTTELEQQVVQLERTLAETQERARGEMERLRDELARTEAAGASQVEQSQRRVDDLESQVGHLRSHLDEAAAEANDLRAQLAAAASTGGDDGDRRQTAVELEHELEIARSDIKHFTDELDEAQGELDALKKVFEDRLAAAEQDGARRADEVLSAGAHHRGAVTQAIGDVLRRHRMRPVLGTSLRELPAFDDTSDRDDLADYLSSTLDSHFERLSSHITELHDEISTLSHARDSSETELEALRSRARSDTDGAQADLASARTAEQTAREELAQAQRRLDNLEMQLREVEQDQVAVRELWGELPRDSTSTPFSTAALVARVKALSSERESLRQQVESHVQDRAQAEATQSDAQQADSSKVYLARRSSLMLPYLYLPVPISCSSVNSRNALSSPPRRRSRCSSGSTSRSSLVLV
jgi:chromosome segregation ATPase